MKITFVIASLHAGGAERVISTLANHFAGAGHQVSLVLFRDERHYPLDSRVACHRITVDARGARYVVCAARLLRRKLRELAPEAVISFLTEINVLSVLASRGQSWKLIVSERNDPRTMPKKKLYRLLRTLLYPLADGYVFQTEQAKACFSAPIRRRGTVIHNPVREDIGARTGEPAGVFRVAAAGRLEAQKNFPLLLESFSDLHTRFPDARLTVYGEGTLRPALERMIRELGLEDAAELPGNVPVLPAALTEASAFVLSSDYEGMSNALMEAMAVGLPCVSTDCPIGGSAELITDGVNGLLVPVGDRERMTEALLTVRQDQALRTRLGANAAQINKTHSLPHIAAAWINYIEEITRR